MVHSIFQEDDIIGSANQKLSALIALGVLVCLIAAGYANFYQHHFADSSGLNATIFFFIAFLLSFILRKNFCIGFLLSLLPFLIAWRIAAMNGVALVENLSGLVMLIYVITFFRCIVLDYRAHGKAGGLPFALEWQMTLLRIYFGFDMVGHCTEKLFDGITSYHHLVSVFTVFGTPVPSVFVIIGGLAELGIAIGIGMGILTRLAACGATLYYFIATLYGQHFALGFTWSMQNPHNVILSGGWEYPMLMMVFFISFVFAGAGKFSLDHYLLKAAWFPQALRILCIPKLR